MQAPPNHRGAEAKEPVQQTTRPLTVSARHSREILVDLQETDPPRQSCHNPASQIQLPKYGLTRIHRGIVSLEPTSKLVRRRFCTPSSFPARKGRSCCQT